MRIVNDINKLTILIWDASAESLQIKMLFTIKYNIEIKFE